MPDPNDIPRRRRVLVLDVTQAAAEVSRLIHEAHDLNLPVEPRRQGWAQRAGPLGGPARRGDSVTPEGLRRSFGCYAPWKARTPPGRHHGRGRSPVRRQPGSGQLTS
jgi:hypothetical protein